MKKILITGISGQDGVFLTKFLLQKKPDINVIGVSRSKSHKVFYKKLNYLGLFNHENIDIFNLNLEDYANVKNFISHHNPDIVYNLSGPSSVYESFTNNESKNSITKIFDNLTTALIETNNFPRFFQASSSEMFGVNENNLNENSSFNPNSPYAEAKLINHLRVKEIRENFDWPIYSGIMFNHESEFRNRNYLVMKIISSVKKILSDPNERLALGSLEYIRDWTYASDTVNAVYEVTTKGESFDYVIGSGKGNSIKDMVSYIFEYFDLDWNNYIEINQDLLREGDPLRIVSDPSKLKNEFNWETKTTFHQMLDICIKGFNNLDSA